MPKSRGLLMNQKKKRHKYKIYMVKLKKEENKTNHNSVT